MEVFASPDLPKRPDFARELASFAWGDEKGFHIAFVVEVDDVRVSEFINAQIQRNVYMQSRVPAFNIDMKLGHSVMAAMALAVGQVPPAP
jgi:hypothetical protein